MKADTFTAAHLWRQQQMKSVDAGGVYMFGGLCLVIAVWLVAMIVGISASHDRQATREQVLEHRIETLEAALAESRAEVERRMGLVR